MIVNFRAVFALLLLSPLACQAQTPVRDGPVEARLASEQVSVQPGKPFTVALVLSIDPDWHVYWKYPGDSGLPTTISWQLPPGFSAGPIQWPVPQKFVSQGLVTYGYPRQVVLLTELSVPAGLKPGQTVSVQARAGWLACRVECTPGAASLGLSLPVSASSPPRDTEWKAAFDEARGRLPVPASGPDFSAAGDSSSLTLRVPASLAAGGPGVEFFPGAPDEVSASAPQRVDRDGTYLRLRLQRDPGAVRLEKLTGLLVPTDFGKTKAVEIEVPVAVSSAASGGALAGLLAALALAFIGGLILNLMPCVLPVISLKALSVLRQGGAHGARHGLLFTLGVLVSFWIIAGVLEGLRAGGRLLGWGFQFQDPAVVVVAAILFFLIGLNLFGVFEVGSLFTRLGARLGGGRNATFGGGTNAAFGGGGGSFATGMFATAVATPCTAPFMGAAVGYALSHSAGASLGVFTALGLGMAAPSLVLALAPGLAARLPKPGPWMETFRQVMAFPMMAAAVWMVAVLGALSGPAGEVIVLAAMLAAGLGAWIWGRWGVLTRRTPVRAAAGVLAVVLIVGAAAAAPGLLPRAVTDVAARTASLSAGSWEPWSAAKVEELRRAGTPVFVDFTAAWCLTCLVNERVTLNNAGVTARFREAGVATLRADWTDTNDEISRGLAAFGRASVPLYVYYPRGGKEPVILPEILTPGIVLGTVGAD
jgi:thiol:disulfide interchange protein/DsbC/DsbD-like thiol-disulfide interchange protein